MKSKYRIVFLGNQSVGKTTLISQYVYKQSDQNYHPTIGIDYLSTQLIINNEPVKIQLWDTAGQERFNSIIPNYTRDCFIAVIVYDLTDPRSFDAIQRWIEDCVKINDEEDKVIIVIVGNKKDLMMEMVKKEAIMILENKKESKRDFEENKTLSNNLDANLKKYNINDRDNNECKQSPKINVFNNENIPQNKGLTDKNNLIDINNTSSNRYQDIVEELTKKREEQGERKAKQFNGHFVMTTAMKYDDITGLVSLINKLVEKDIMESGNVIDLGGERETINLVPKNNKRCCS